MEASVQTSTQGSERGWWLLFGAWLIATLGTLGSLFFSEVMHRGLAGRRLAHAALRGRAPRERGALRQGVSCTTEYLELLGFLSIPALSLLAFTAVSALLLLFRRSSTP